MVMDCRHDGACGLYCGACDVLRANDTGSVEALAKQWGMDPDDLICRGCQTDTIAVFCRDCIFRDCTRSRGIAHCSECDEFPCDALVRFRNDAAPHHSAVLHNSEQMREVGVERWLEDQRVRWSCPSCHASFCWEDTTCAGCGSMLRDSRAEEAELDAAG